MWTGQGYSLLLCNTLCTCGVRLVDLFCEVSKISAVEEFLEAPSESLSDVLTKDQLGKVAAHFLIESLLPKSAKKEQMVQLI